MFTKNLIDSYMCRPIYRSIITYVTGIHSWYSFFDYRYSYYLVSIEKYKIYGDYRFLFCYRYVHEENKKMN